MFASTLLSLIVMAKKIQINSYFNADNLEVSSPEETFVRIGGNKLRLDVVIGTLKRDLDDEKLERAANELFAEMTARKQMEGRFEHKIC